MKTPCNVIRDLLPLYQDGVCSPESCQLVAEHLEECDTCRVEWERMHAPLPTDHPHVEERTVVEAASSAWKRGRRGAFRKGFVIAAVLVVAVSAVIGIWVYTTSLSRYVRGRIVETQVDDATGAVSLVVYTSQGEEIGLQLSGKTSIFSFFDQYSAKDLEAGKITDPLRISAEVQNAKTTMFNQDGEKIPAYPAQYVQVEAYLRQDTICLGDGTQLERWQKVRETVYALPNGPDLVEEFDLSTLDASTGGIGSLDQLSQETWNNIAAYYEKQKPSYDLQTELEAAYQSYLQEGSPDSFYPSLLGTETFPTASSPRVVYFTTTVYAPSGQKNVNAAFYKDTGEQVDMEDLFTCTPEELEQALLDEAEITDPTLRQEMEKAFGLHLLKLHPDNLEVWYDAGTLPSQDDAYCLAFDYDDTILERMHAWAVPYSQ